MANIITSYGGNARSKKGMISKGHAKEIMNRVIVGHERLPGGMRRNIVRQYKPPVHYSFGPGFGK